METLTEQQSARRRRRTTQNPFGCLGCLGSTAALMGIFAVVIWAFNPEMDARQAIREGILWGGGVTIAATSLFCVVPGLLLIAAVTWIIWRRRSEAVRSAPTVIDIEP